MPYRFIFSTWLLILPVNIVSIAVALLIHDCMETGNFALNNIFDSPALVMIAVFSVPFAIPGLFGLMIAVWTARELFAQLATQFLFIVLSCCFITVACYFLLEFILNLDLKVRDYTLFLTASLAAVVAVLSFTRRYYYAYIKSSFNNYSQ